MQRLFNVQLGTPEETSRGGITLSYRQMNVKEALDISSAGRGMLQMLLVFAYLYSHKGSVLLVDEPDAHLEILRQKQVYVLLRDIASENGAQVVMVTHSEQILEEALDRNLTLLIEGRADDLAGKQDIRNSLKHFGADHYVRARERGYVLYVEGGTDVDMLRALAERLEHRAAKVWDERINTFYVQNNYPAQTADAELERVEGGFGITPRDHFNGLRGLLPKLQGLALLDNDGQNRRDSYSDAIGLRESAAPIGAHKPRAAASTARNSARHLFMVSFHSNSGMESATTPPAACTCSWPFWMIAVRIAMAKSASSCQLK